MSSTSSHNVPTDWEANERSSNDPRTLGPGDIIWAKFSIPRVIEKTNRRREHYEGNLTPEQAKEIGPMEVSPGSSRKRHSGLFIPQPQKSSSLDSDIPDDALRDRPCLVLFTCQRGSDVGYISAPLTQLKGLKPEQSTFRETPGFYKMIYPVSPQARFKIPAGPNGVSRPQKLLPIPGWETRSDHQYCTLGSESFLLREAPLTGSPSLANSAHFSGALVKVNRDDAGPDSSVHRLQPDVLRQAQREAMGLMTPLERSRLHIGTPTIGSSRDWDS